MPQADPAALYVAASVEAPYVRGMPPCTDVYIWVDNPTPGLLRRFIARYVDHDEPGSNGFRLEAFRRVYIDDSPESSDHQALGGPGEFTEFDGTFTIYLASPKYCGVIIAPISEGPVVLGVSLDDPDGSPETLDRAVTLMDALRAEYGASAAIAGVELPPPRTRSEWGTAWGVERRIGVLDH